MRIRNREFMLGIPWVKREKQRGEASWVDKKKNEENGVEWLLWGGVHIKHPLAPSLSFRP